MSARRLRLFEYAVLLHPDSPNKEVLGAAAKFFPKETVLVKQDQLLAVDEKSANMKIIADLVELDKGYLEHAERLEVALRPFEDGPQGWPRKYPFAYSAPLPPSPSAIEARGIIRQDNLVENQLQQLLHATAPLPPAPTKTLYNSGADILNSR